MTQQVRSWNSALGISLCSQKGVPKDFAAALLTFAPSWRLTYAECMNQLWCNHRVETTQPREGINSSRVQSHTLGRRKKPDTEYTRHDSTSTKVKNKQERDFGYGRAKRSASWPPKKQVQNLTKLSKPNIPGL